MLQKFHSSSANGTISVLLSNERIFVNKVCISLTLFELNYRPGLIYAKLRQVCSFHTGTYHSHHSFAISNSSGFLGLPDFVAFKDHVDMRLAGKI